MDASQRREVFGDLYDPEWEKFMGDPVRWDIAATVLRVYRLLEQGNIPEARYLWEVAAEELRGRFRRIFLKGPAEYVAAPKNITPRLLSDVASVIGQLNRSTNDEPLQMLWRIVSERLA
jgi:hypothetical protein